MPRRLGLSALIVLLLLGLAACGSSSSGGGGRSTGAQASHPGSRGEVDPATSKVIRAWAQKLAKGDLAGAAGYFAIPSVVQNGTPVLRLRTPGQVRIFNTALPCGAKVVRLTRRGAFTVATFKLTDRPGPGGGCGAGAGGTAATAFVISHGKIRVWLRVDDPSAIPKTAPDPGATGPGIPAPAPRLPQAQGPVV